MSTVFIRASARRKKSAKKRWRPGEKFQLKASPQTRRKGIPGEPAATGEGPQGTGAGRDNRNKRSTAAEGAASTASTALTMARARREQLHSRAHSRVERRNRVRRKAPVRKDRAVLTGRAGPIGLREKTGPIEKTGAPGLTEARGPQPAGLNRRLSQSRARQGLSRSQ